MNTRGMRWICATGEVTTVTAGFWARPNTEPIIRIVAEAEDDARARGMVEEVSTRARTTVPNVK